ncbi:MAG: class I SAM-dependent methyltransferase [Acidimicrobiia bacterium]|nr:class I SAM-dependent methyltransferase [Acidimicrobiia bacterium]
MTGATASRVNRWVDAAWAERFLSERDEIPHRADGFAALLEVLPERVGRVLDLGTGDGFALSMVLGERPGASGVGVDFQPAMLARAAERFDRDDRVELIEHDLDLRLPDSLGIFDLVVSSFAIHHCSPDRQRSLYAEVYDLLEPGGMFVNLEHVASPTRALHEEFLGAIGKTPEHDDPSNQLVEVVPLLGWLVEAGFTDADCLWKWRELALLTARRP